MSAQYVELMGKVDRDITRPVNQKYLLTYIKSASVGDLLIFFSGAGGNRTFTDSKGNTYTSPLTALQVPTGAAPDDPAEQIAAADIYFCVVTTAIVPGDKIFVEPVGVRNGLVEKWSGIINGSQTILGSGEADGSDTFDVTGSGSGIAVLSCLSAVNGDNGPIYPTLGSLSAGWANNNFDSTSRDSSFPSRVYGTTSFSAFKEFDPADVPNINGTFTNGEGWAILFIGVTPSPEANDEGSGEDVVIIGIDVVDDGGDDDGVCVDGRAVCATMPLSGATCA